MRGLDPRIHDASPIMRALRKSDVAERHHGLPGLQARRRRGACHRAALRADPLAPLEHFQAKWEPVRRPEMRQNKEIERFHDSTQHESALARQ
jgi:hypothetical protein